MGPSSSGSQATVASVVTSTLLAGLGVGGGVISSLPSSVWPTQAPQATQNPTRPSTQPAKSSTEQAPPQGSDTDTIENQSAHEGEEDEEEEPEEEEDEKKGKNKNTSDNKEVQGDSTVAKNPLIPTPASTAKEKEGRPTVKDTTVPASTGDQQLVNIEEKPTDVNRVSTQMTNDSAEMQIPQSSTLSPKISSLWPFSVHTGEQTSFLHSQIRHIFFQFTFPLNRKILCEFAEGKSALSLCTVVVSYHTWQNLEPKQNFVNTSKSYGTQFSITNNLI